MKLKKEKIIHEQTATYCTHQLEEKVTGIKFYYKVHKGKEIHTMPLRPLQSCISGPTHHLSQVLTDILQPLLREENIPTFIQDSNQLLFRLNKLAVLTEEDTIISSDVSALYPSIPHVEGLIAMKEFLEEFSIYNKTQIDIRIKALELVITRNYVMWNGNIYEQTRGVAMGTPVAVAYANIFMNWIDTQIKTKAPYIIEHIRYIDDNLIILPQDKIAELISIANNILSPHIKYTYEVLDKKAEKGLPFLDTQLFISEEYTIESRLYTKSTDRHCYDPSSYHPTHITRNIPLSVFYRLRRVCSKEEWFKADVMTAISWLEDRDYSYKDICRAIGKAIDKDRWELIENIEMNRGREMRMIEEIRGEYSLLCSFMILMNVM